VDQFDDVKEKRIFAVNGCAGDEPVPHLPVEIEGETPMARRQAVSFRHVLFFFLKRYSRVVFSRRAVAGIVTGNLIITLTITRKFDSVTPAFFGKDSLILREVPWR